MGYCLPGSSCPWDFPGKNIGEGCHFLLQGIFPTQGLNPCLLQWTGGFFTTESPRKSLNHSWPCINYTIIVTYLTFCPILPLRAESHISSMYRYMSKDPTVFQGFMSLYYHHSPLTLVLFTATFPCPLAMISCLQTVWDSEITAKASMTSTAVLAKWATSVRTDTVEGKVRSLFILVSAWKSRS